MLHLHRAERADGLVAALRGLLAQPLPDPFAPEVVAVPTQGDRGGHRVPLLDCFDDGVEPEEEIRRVIAKLTRPFTTMMRNRIQATAAARPKLFWAPQPSS